MPGRKELILRAAAANVNYVNYPNDSKLEQAVLYAEKNMIAQTGTASTLAAPALAVSGISGDKNV